jgi:hypothetical protein
MKKVSLPGIVFAGLLFMACDKDVKSNENDLIRANINTQYMSFNYFTKASLSYPVKLNLPNEYLENLYCLSVRGYHEQSVTSNSLMINIFSDKPLTPGVYIQKPSGLPYVQIYYSFINAQDIISTVSTEATVGISSISEKHIEGTFSCIIFYNDAMARRVEVKINDGRFNLDF